MRHTPHCEPRTAPTRADGSVLILVIVAIVFLGALTSGIVSLLGTSNLDTTVANQVDKVEYNSESGYRFLAQQYDTQGDDNGNGYPDDDQANLLIALNGATVNLPGNLGSFTLDIRPYWFIATALYTNASTITVRVPGSFPDNYNLPSSGVVDVQDNSLHTYSSFSKNDPYVTFNLSDTVNVDPGRSVYITLPPTGAQNVAEGGSLTLSSTSGTVFPDRLGKIQVGNKVVSYDSASFNSGSNVITLNGLSDALNVGSSDAVILKRCAYIKSSGQAGSGGFSTTNDVAYNRYFADDTTEAGNSQEGGAQVSSSFSAGDTGGRSSNSGGGGGGRGYIIATYTSGDGTTTNYLVSTQSGESADPDSSCSSHIRWNYGDFTASKAAMFASAWQTAYNHLLSYDYQLKEAWGYLLDYGAGGLTFREHEVSSGLFNLMGLSFIKYKHANSCSAPQGQRDDIPDSIKPTTAAGGSLAGHCLLVLWIQEVSGGAEHRKWVAYKDLSSDACVSGEQWENDGLCMTDDSTLMVRVVEKMVNGTKTSDITAYYGDASDPDNTGWWEHSGHNWIYHSGACTTRTPNTIDYDEGTLRQVYFKNSTYPVGTSPFPTFPPDSYTVYTPSIDYFSFVQNGGGTPAACTLCDWDRVNPAAAADFALQSDGGTLRTSKFVSPSSGTFDADVISRREVGWNDFNGGNGNSVIGHAEYAVRILVPSSGGSQLGSGSIMR
jgi:hypothetical protein